MAQLLMAKLEAGWLLLMPFMPVILKFFSASVICYVSGSVFLYGYREHAYLYQLSNKKRAIDNWIGLIRPLISRFDLTFYRTSLTRDLNRSAFRVGWDSSHFIAFQILCAMGAFVVTFFFAFLIFSWPLIIPIGVSLYAFIFPRISLHSRANQRFTAVRRDLPYFIDYLGLAMGAGLDFNQGLRKVLDDAPKSPLKDEFYNVLRNIRLGMGRSDALLEMERRLDAPQLKLFVQTLVQAMNLGTDVVSTMNVMSETFQQKRFQTAEEAAGKISVRMMMPMMVFVLPTIMIILIGPMILSSPLFSGM